jgi:hypothetical protein
MVYERVAEASEAKRCVFYVSGRFSVVKDREHFVMALMIRRKGK